MQEEINMNSAAVIKKSQMQSLFKEFRDEHFEMKLKEADLSPLLVAARDTDLETCLKLWKFSKHFERAADVTESGLTLMHFAAVNAEHGEDIAIYFSFLEIGQRDKDGEEPIHYALRRGHYPLARYLLMLKNEGSYNLLQFFAIENDLYFAKLVHALDAKLITKVDQDGVSALHYAAEFASRTMCRWLIEQNPDLTSSVSKRNCSALHFACKNRRHGEKLVTFFVLRGLDVNHADDLNLTPLHVALRAGNLSAAEQLLGFDASTKVRCKDFYNLMHFCAEENLLEAAKLMHKNDSSLIFGVCLGGFTALHVAATNGHFEFCKWLVYETPLDANAVDANNHTALHYLETDGELKQLLSKATKVRRGTLV